MNVDARSGSESLPGLDTAYPTLQIGADLGDCGDGARLELLLEGFAGLHRVRPEARLSLAWRRSRAGRVLMQNLVEAAGLAEVVRLYPYLDRCRDFPRLKRDCALWLDAGLPDSALETGALQRALARPAAPVALFVTAMDPAKAEGNSTLMRQWLMHLRGAGYRIHVLYYEVQPRATGPVRLDYPCDLLHTVPVETLSVGSNRNGLNLHVDDWCGPEVIEAAAGLAERTSYDLAIVNYAFLSGVFEALPAYTRKILLTHDSFADRNRRLLADGIPESAWLSLTRDGEALACRRSDVVVAVQEDEARHFQELTGGASEVRLVAPVPSFRPVAPPPRAAKLRVGCLGSSNWVNEINLVQFMRAWADRPTLTGGAELVLAGGLCETLSRVDPDRLADRLAVRMLGRRQDLSEVFGTIDVFVNPERGGSGIKIKTLDALAHGVPVLTTAAGSVGLGSRSRFHNAPDPAALAALVAEVAADPALLDEVRRDSAALWEAHAARHGDALAGLLGEIRNPNQFHAGLPASIRAEGETPVVPDYVAQTGADYHVPEFRQVWDRFDLTGKRVLEVGSDYHLASARLFRANGAAEVVATNLGNWFSDEPLPDGVRFICGDVSDIAEREFEAGSFDIVYGIAVLEHIPDLDRVARAVARLLAPGGVVYFQGCPLWPGALGHHVWLSTDAVREADGDPTAINGFEAAYSFANEALNPIPHWAHLSHTPDKLRALLVERDIPPAHADRIVEFVYNHGGAHTGICSNFRAASEVVAAFGAHLQVLPDPIVYADPASPHFQAARAKYSDDDLAALGMRLWATLPVDQSPADKESVAPAAPQASPERVPEPIAESVPAQATEQAPEAAAAAAPAAEPPAEPTAAEVNDRRAREIIAAYEATASEAAKTFPAMLTTADRAMYFHAARHFTFTGAIVDAGCFVGGTTRNLVEGLLHNPLFAGRREASKGLIRVYDLFQIDDDYIRHHLQNNYPDTDFSGQASFLPVFQRNLAEFADLLDVRPGDVTGVGYPDAAPIEVLGVDLCKALFVTDFTVRSFFPRLLPDALVLQQDYIHEFHPYIHLSMLRLEGHFRTDVEFRWGGTVAFRLGRPVTAADLHDAFGPNDSWYGDVATNTALLRRLIAEALCDENRWIYYLTLAIYLTHNNRHSEARAVVAEAKAIFPHYEPSEITTRMVAGDGA